MEEPEPNGGRPPSGAEMRPVSGGLLLQVKDRIDAPGDDPTTWTLATGEPLDAAGLDDAGLRERLGRALPINVGAFMASMLGLAMVVVGLALG